MSAGCRGCKRLDISVTVVCVSVDRFSITLPSELGSAVRAAAEAESRTISAWLASAVTAELRRRALDEALVAWQAQHGELMPEELAAAAETLANAPRTGRRQAS